MEQLPRSPQPVLPRYGEQKSVRGSGWSCQTGSVEDAAFRWACDSRGRGQSQPSAASLEEAPRCELQSRRSSLLLSVSAFCLPVASGPRSSSLALVAVCGLFPVLGAECSGVAGLGGRLLCLAAEGHCDGSTSLGVPVFLCSECGRGSQCSPALPEGKIILRKREFPRIVQVRKDLSDPSAQPLRTARTQNSATNKTVLRITESFWVEKSFKTTQSNH